MRSTIIPSHFTSRSGARTNPIDINIDTLGSHSISLVGSVVHSLALVAAAAAASIDDVAAAAVVAAHTSSIEMLADRIIRVLVVLGSIQPVNVATTLHTYINEAMAMYAYAFLCFCVSVCANAIRFVHVPYCHSRSSNVSQSLFSIEIL